MPAALPRQQAQPAERYSAAAATVAARVSRQRRMEAVRFVKRRARNRADRGDGNPSVVIVVTKGLLHRIRNPIPPSR